MTTNAANQDTSKDIKNTTTLGQQGSNYTPDDKDKDVTNILSYNNDDDDDDIVVAPISIAPDGGWGWVVVAASFWNLFNILGTGFTFGAMKSYIMVDIKKDIASIAVINSLALGLMCLFGPIASALINRFGFRIVSMTGAVVCALAMFISSFAVNYAMLLAFYGVVLGIGYAFTYSCSNLVVGFYFEKKRALAMAITICGNSVGVTMWSPLVNILNKIGWRPTIMLQSSMLATMFFSSMAYKPLLSITVHVKPKTSKTKKEVSETIPAKDRELNVNTDFKLAKDVVGTAESRNEVKEPEELTDQARTSSKTKSRVSVLSVATLLPNPSRVEEVYEFERQAPSNLKVTINNEEQEPPQGCCAKFFSWTPHVKEARPLYRDDAFYRKNVDKLVNLDEPGIPGSKRKLSGIEYKLAVSRITTAKDLKEKKGLCSTAVTRVLASMADPRLLKLRSFDMMLLSVFMTYSGIIIPFNYLADRSKQLNIAEHHYQWFVSVFSAAGMFGRILIGILTNKIRAVYCCQIFGILAGASCIASNYMTHPFLQYCFCIFYGFTMSGVVICRNLIIVDLYGLKLLTNAAGLVAFSMGTSYFASPPIAGLIMSNFGVLFSFLYAGTNLIVGALLLILVPILHKREKGSNLVARN